MESSRITTLGLFWETDSRGMVESLGPLAAVTVPRAESCVWWATCSTEATR